MRSPSELVRSRVPALATGHGAVALVVFLASAPAGLAQSLFESLPGQNAAQRDMARAMDALCPALDARQNQSRSGDEMELQRNCARLTSTALEASGEGPLPGALSFGLTVEETNNALQSMNGEEMQAAQKRVGDIQASNITGRLAAIRAGVVGRGLSTAGLRLGSGGQSAFFHDDRGDSADGPLLASAGGSPQSFLMAQADETEPWFGPWGLFLTGSVVFGDKDATGSVDGFDFVLPGVTAGADYKVSENLVVGGAFGFSHFDADFDVTPQSPAKQSLDANSYSLSVFGSYFIGEKFFVEGIGSIGYSGYDSTRRIVIPSRNPTPPVNRTAKSDPHAIQYSVAANLGYRYTLRGVELQPVARVRYLAAEIDGFTETGAGGWNLEYGDQDVDSLTTRVGLQASYAVGTPIGVVVPYVRGEYVHEFLNDNDGPPVRYAADPTPERLSRFVITTEDPDRNYADLGAGVALTLPHGWVTFLDYAAVVGFSDFAIHSVAAGFRKDF